MRLTLRTLLALLDGILDPQDQTDLQQQVDSSDYAKNLVHRTRDVMGRQRLGAPPVESELPANDPNLAAEYLDNTLDPARVADYERICLESDEHLAEAAASHHVLTMVLGQPAEVDADLRQKMYRLPEVLAAAKLAPPKPAPVVPPAALAASVPPAPVAHRPAEVPDYLRAAQRPLLARLMPAIAMLLLLSTVSYFCFSPGGWLRPANQIAQGTGAEEAPPFAPEPTETPDPVPLESVEENSAPAPEVPSTETVSPTPEPPTADPLAMVPPAAEPPTPEPTTSAPPTATVEPDEPAAVSTEPAAPTGDTPAAATVAATPETPPMATETPAADAEVKPEPAASADAPPASLGMFDSAHEMVLRMDAEKQWRRLPVRTSIQPGDRLLALPTYRPRIDLSSGVGIDLSDATEVVLQAPKEADAAIAIQFGRVLVTNISAEERKVRLEVGALQGVATLGPQSTLAVAVDRQFQAGVDPNSGASPLLAVFAAPEGNVAFTAPDVDFKTTGPSSWELAGDSLGPVQDYMPLEWVSSQPMTAPDSLASPKLELQIDDASPAWTQLLGIFGASQKKEERALAARCSLFVGNFDPFVDSLRDEDQKLSWESHIRTLRDVMARSPELAQAVKQELVSQRGAEKADDLYEMLAGYSPEEIGATPEERRVGALAKLIDWLENDQLDYRVLANYNLEQITGRRGVFSPSGPERGRETAIAKLRKRLEDDDLKPPVVGL